MDGGLAYYIRLRFYSVDTVRHGIYVRHCANCGVARLCSRTRSGFNRLFIRKTGLTKMNMNINETRN